MDELQQVMATAAEEDAAGRPWALATIVDVSGSTYRRPGARLVVRDDNSWVGNLSGGCLEGEVLEVGGAAMDDGVPRREFYDLTADEEAIWGWGLGCNGAMDVFVAPSGSARRHLDLLQQGRESGRPFRLVTIVGGPDDAALGATALVPDGADVVGFADDVPPTAADAQEEVVAVARGLDRSGLVEVGDRTVFVERVTPPLRLLVCGAGHDAIPLVARAAALGWEVVVVDDREVFLDPERFPGAASFVHTPPGEVATATGADERTAAVVMSHNFMRDADYLASLAPVGLAYLGMLGPGTRLERLVDHLDREDIDVRPHLDRVHGPAGLDLAAEGPDEIAVAIVAEVLAATRGAGAGFLRDKDGSIHDDRDPA